MDVQIITIGDEILIGQIVDTNSAWMAQQLNLHGLKVQQIHSISDSQKDIIDTLQQAVNETDVVLITGGLGPTKDDITKKAIADYFGVSMVFHQETYERIVRMFERWGRSTTEAHRQQCFMPENALLLKNKMGTAPGMWFEKEGKVIVSMPGVPYEMKYLMEHEVLPKLRQRSSGIPIAHRTILTVGEGESRLAQKIEAFEKKLPPDIKLAYLPGLGSVRLRLSGRSKDEITLNKQLDLLVEELNKIIPEFIYGYDSESLPEIVGRILRQQKKTLCTAESCTGGHLAHLITTVPGSSDYFVGSVVAYANKVKIDQLGVSPQTLECYGAVSKETVIEMVNGALKLLQTDFAIAISGIAGPGGGTEEKPVGTIWMAVGNQNGVKTKKLQLGKDRLKNIEYTSVQSLNMIRKYLLGMEIS